MSLKSTALPAVIGALVMGAGAVTLNLPGAPGSDDPVVAEMYTDPIADYGVCRGVDPSCYNDWGAGWEEGERKRVLIWSRTAGPRHAHLGTPLAAGLNPPLNPDNVAQANLKAWAEEQGIEVDYTEDLAQFRPNNYNTVVFLSSNRDTLDDTAQTALKQYVRRGGGFVGIHNAFGAEYSFEYYEGLLGGANFYDHQPNRPGTVETVNREDVSTENLPATWGFTDEWYNLTPYPSFVNVLLKVDAATSARPEGSAGHPGHGDNHPVSWCHYYDGGRAWLTTLGHDVKAWTDEPLPGDVEFKEHVVNGLLSTMGIEPFCQPADGSTTTPDPSPTASPTPTSSPTSATPTTTPPPPSAKVAARIGTAMVKPVGVDTKRRLRVSVRARGSVPSGTVEVRVKGAGERASYTETLNGRGRTSMWLPKFSRPGKVSVRITYLGDDAVESRKKRLTFAVVRRSGR